MAPLGSTLLLVRGSALHSEIRAGLVVRSVCFNQDVKALVPDSSIFQKFLTYSILGRESELLKLVSSAGNTAGVLDTKLVQGLNIWVPLLNEQAAIVGALDDVDTLLSGLDALIAKKRDLKQAAMQQLLTGKTRLPGFCGEWELRRLGNHVSFIKNGVNSRAELGVGDRAKYLHYGDIHTTSDVFLLPESASMPTLAAEKAARLGRLADGDVVFVDATEDLAGVGKSVEIRGIGGAEVVAGLHTIAARFDKAILADGFKAYLQFIPAFGRHLRTLAAGTKVFATNRAHIASAEIALPSTEEQVAIAEALHDMDAELSALEARRDKTRLLKQGMMQELLTGRTRLA